MHLPYHRYSIGKPAKILDSAAVPFTAHFVVWGAAATSEVPQARPGLTRMTTGIPAVRRTLAGRGPTPAPAPTETNICGQLVRERGVGEGFNDLELGVRLRYEIRREFAPYIGVAWTKKFGDTADFVRAEGDAVDRFNFVVGSGSGSDGRRRYIEVKNGTRTCHG